MIEDLLSQLTPDEVIYYNESKDRITKFHPTIKPKIGSGKTNMSHGFMFTMAQATKYTTSPSPKTRYSCPKNSSKEIIDIVNAINSTTDYIERSNLISLKIIFEARHYKQDLYNANIDSYEKYTIKAGQTQKCVRCSSSNTIPYTKQKRSADEPSETYYICQDCNCEFKPHVHIVGLLNQ